MVFQSSDVARALDKNIAIMLYFFVVLYQYLLTKIQKMIDLNAKRQDVIAVATELFEKFVSMSKDVRSDDKKRTGIQVLVWEPGTRNLVMISAKDPSEAAKFFSIEKAVRAECNFDHSSQNSANPGKMQFAGSVALQMNEIPGFGNLSGNAILVASTSGLKEEEDVAVSIAILSKITGLTFKEVCNIIDLNDGLLPDWCYNETKGYFQFLFD